MLSSIRNCSSSEWLARVAAEWDDRLGAIKRLAESSVRDERANDE